ncbi:MAG: FAD-dependent thymidylate synthase [Elusimicrobia bacterium]|nr:FAD-dependent thymidylate synthase [Elusimicrobiota bacterium]
MTAAQEILEENVLDKGFIRLIEFMGGDPAVVLGARVSYAQGLKGDEKDKKLVFYLMQHSHMTPFEQAVLKFHVKCPIFVMRQWIRHRIGSFNEHSARYSEMADEFYIPAEFRKQDVKNKQGSLAAGAEIDQKEALAEYTRTIGQTYATYQSLIAAGAAREMARMVLPTALYTQFYWTVNARSLMNFILLRAEGHAQWEIQQYALALAKFFKMRMPWTWEAFLRFTWKGGNPVLDQEKAQFNGS